MALVIDADTGIEFPDGSVMTTAAEQSDWDQQDSTAKSFIKNKPDLSGFAKKDLSNVTKPYVTEAWKSSDGTSWWRKYSDGFIEQSSLIANGSSGDRVNLIVPMNKERYSVQITCFSGGPAAERLVNINNNTMSKTSFQIFTNKTVAYGNYLVQGY